MFKQTDQTNFEKKNKLDHEWLLLIKEAKNMGIPKDEVLHFLRHPGNYKIKHL